MLHSLIIITYNRKNELKETLENIFSLKRPFDEVIIINNGSTDGTRDLLEKLKYKYNYKAYHLDKNLGVAAARNFGIKLSSGNILTFLDDDAIFDTPDPVNIIEKYFSTEPKLGILAFKIVNLYTKKIKSIEFPSFSLLGKRKNPNEEFLTSYYIGAGHSIRKEVFEKCGLYPDYFFYGGEELYLSFKALNKGFYIKYTPKIVVYHKASPRGRISNNEKWSLILRNKFIINYKFLPSKYRFINNISWVLKLLLQTRSPKIIWKAYKNYLKYKDIEDKEILNSEVLKYLKKYEGRLWH